MKTHLQYLACENCQCSIREDEMDGHLILCKDGIDHRICNRDQVELTPCAASSVNGYFKRWDIKIANPEDYHQMLEEYCQESSIILTEVLKLHPVKVQAIVTVGFEHSHPEGVDYVESTFRTIIEPIAFGDDIVAYMSRVKAQQQMQIEKFQRLGSGWTYSSLVSAHLDIAKYIPLTIGSYIEVPKKVKAMKSTLNIKSTDYRCFLYCLLAKKCMLDDTIAVEKAKAQGLSAPKKKYPEGGSKQRASSYYPFENELNMDGITYPIKMTAIKKVEEQNNLSISIFEWDFDESCAIPMRHGRGEGTPVELLYLEQDERSHYVLITNFNKFMHHRSKNGHVRHFCMKCLFGFASETKLSDHIKLCNQRVYQVTRMPPPGNIKFQSHWKGIRKLFVIYADFETKLVPVEDGERDPNPPKRRLNNKGKVVKVPQSYTNAKQIHAPCSFSMVTQSELKDYKPEELVFSNEKAQMVSQEFLAELNRVHAKMMQCYEDNTFDIDMTEEDEIAFQNSIYCHICKKELDWSGKIVRDHDHLLEKKNFRGASHNRCNLNYWERTKKVVVLFHNMPYDLNNFLLELIRNTDDEKDITIIPENLEKFKSIQDKHFIFLDTFNFLTSSLETLVENLKGKGPHHFKRLRDQFPNNYELLMQKCSYPYDYVTDFSVFSDTSLPPKESFKNALYESEISDVDYARAQKIWDEMECETFLNYMELYVLTDSLLLCDVFESFRSLCMQYYGLDPCHYMSLPAIGYDAMLKMTGVEIEKITDSEMYQFLFANLRGGITTINRRQAKANNPYLLDYNENKPTTYIQYLDVCNLYGYGLQGPLPLNGFRWLSQRELKVFDLYQDPDAKDYFIVEVDLDYPKELHDAHTCYPMAVEKRCISSEELSAYNLKFLEKHEEKHSSVQKLVPDLNKKSNYVCSLKNLQFFLKHGLILKKIHRVLTAHQEAWMRPFIEFNTARRSEVTSKFDKDLFKLFNNSCYGKLIEDVRKRRNVGVVKSEIRAKRLTTKPQMTNFHMIDKDATLIQSVKRVLTLDKPLACGFQVLETAKHLMLEWWYDVLKAKYGNKVTLILSDTDSLLYMVETHDAYQDLVADDMKDKMDLSANPDVILANGSRLHSNANKKVVGKMADERPGEIISEVIALKSKMYSIKTQSYWYPSTSPYGEEKRAKGVPKTAKKKMTHEDYRQVLKDSSTNTATFRAIRSVHHINQTLELKKRALSAFDDKKYILDNGVETLSYGHYKISDEVIPEGGVVQ